MSNCLTSDFLEHAEMIQLFSFACGPAKTNTYIVICRETREAIVIDPSPGSAEKIISSLLNQKAILTGIWLTHSHWDHIADCKALRDYYGDSLPISIHLLDKDNVILPGSDGLPIPCHIEPQKPTILFREGDILKVGKSEFQVLHTPGHSPGSSSFLSLDSNLIFTGDTLFKGTYGNVSFPTSSPQAMKESLQKLSGLEPSTLEFYPGHGPSSILQNEHKWITSLIKRHSM